MLSLQQWNLDVGKFGFKGLYVISMSECYHQIIEHRSLTRALNRQHSTETFERFVDDSRARFKARKLSFEFLDILNSDDPSIQCNDTRLNWLSFLDITVTNTVNSWCDLGIFEKLSITNVQIKSNSNIAPHTALGVFKGFFSFTSIQKIHRKVLPEENRFLKRHFYRK